MTDQDRSSERRPGPVEGGRSAKRWLLGEPLATDRLEGQLLPKHLALPIFARDPLSSVAYAPQELLMILLDSSTLIYGRRSRPLPGQDRRGEPIRPVLRAPQPPAKPRPSRTTRTPS